MPSVKLLAVLYELVYAVTKRDCVYYGSKFPKKMGRFLILKNDA